MEGFLESLLYSQFSPWSGTGICRFSKVLNMPKSYRAALCARKAIILRDKTITNSKTNLRYQIVISNQSKQGNQGAYRALSVKSERVRGFNKRMETVREYCELSEVKMGDGAIYCDFIWKHW